MVAGILVASYPRAIDPGDVHVIDLTEVQDCLGLGLSSRQFDGFSKPHHAIVAGQPGVFKMTGQFHGFPLGVIKGKLGPSFALGTRIHCHDQSRPTGQWCGDRLDGHIVVQRIDHGPRGCGKGFRDFRQVVPAQCLPASSRPLCSVPSIQTVPGGNWN